MKFTVVFHHHIRSSMEFILNYFPAPKVVVEIGVFEGETTFNLANVLSSTPGYKQYAIDPFLSTEHLRPEVVAAAKELFIENHKEFPEVEWIEKRSFEGLLDLHNRGVRANFIYVDGSHFAPDVLADAVLGFELLEPGGIMLFDDSVGWQFGDRAQDSPKIAVDNFIQCNWHRLRVLELPNGSQTGILKL